LNTANLSCSTDEKLKSMFPRIVFVWVLCVPVLLFAQEKKIKGTVLDDMGHPLPGINVTVKGKHQGAVTDSAGSFGILAAKGDVLRFSSVNYEGDEQTIGDGSTYLMALHSKVRTISDVVVVGYGVQRKKDLTGALTSISTKDFKDQPITSVSQILQGRSAGVQVTSNAGAPGGNVSVRIRGNNSIKGDNNPLYVIDGFVGADYSTLNPADIESMEVLKDASATAIYGSRGANGVVLITTKRGKPGQLQVDFSPRFSSSRVIKKLDLLNAADFAETANANAAATGTSPIFTPDQIAQFRKTGGTNWQDEIFRTAPTQEYQLGISGGTDKTSFYISGNYLDQQGVIINSYLKRYAFRSNLQSQLTDKLSLHLNVSAARLQSCNTTGNLGRFSPVTQAIAWSPTLPVYDAKGNYTLNDPISSITYNPVAIAKDQSMRNDNTAANLMLGLRYEFIPGLSLDVSGGVNYTNAQGRNYTGPAVSQNLPSASRSSLEGIALQSTNNLTYTHLFGTDHRLTLMGVFEVQSFTSNGFNASGNNLTYPSMEAYNLALAATYGVGTTYSNYSLYSYLGRVNYSFKDKYLLTASLRRDGSSKFQGNNQYSVFPSAGVAWRLSEEPFIKALHKFDNLKIRAGYGVTGNQAINPYQTLTTYSNVTTAFTTGTVTPGILLGNPGNPNLKWETTRQADIGVDADFLQNRLSVSADYYVKNTNNLLLSVAVPAYAGGGSVLSNVGKVQNKGIELTVSGTPVMTKDFKWTSSFNFAVLNNTVKQLVQGQDTLFTGSNVGSGLSTQSEFVLIPGQRMGSYWGLTYLGTWKPKDAADAAKFGAQPGDARYQDLDGNNIINGADYHVIGNGLPKYSWGWNNSFTYKGLTLNIFLQSLSGFDKLDYTYAAGITANSDVRQATIADIRNRYIPGVNETSDIPAFSKTNKNYTLSTRFLENGSFIRFKNIGLSYELPKSLLHRPGITVSLSGTNLITITKYKGFDPETNSVTSGAGADVNQGIDYGSYPNAKTVTLGFNFKF